MQMVIDHEHDNGVGCEDVVAGAKVNGLRGGGGGINFQI